MTRDLVLDRLRDYAQQLFDEQPQLRSLLVAIFERFFATDATADGIVFGVGMRLVASPRMTPLWPHRCVRFEDLDSFGDRAAPDEDEEQCNECWLFDNPFIDDLGVPRDSVTRRSLDMLMPYTTPFKHPGAGVTPYAIARRREDGVEVEIVEMVQRPQDLIAQVDTSVAPRPLDARAQELLVSCTTSDDGPRHVLADHLIEQGDPRGEYLSLALAANLDLVAIARRDALLSEHRVRWLQPLAGEIVHPQFHRGLLASVEVFASSAEHRDAVTWASVEELRFLPGSATYISPAMRALRHVGPLRVDAFETLIDDTAWPFEQLDLEGVDLVRLAEAKLPKLRELWLDTNEWRFDELARASWWHRLHRVVRVCDRRELEPELVASWFHRLPDITPVPWLGIVVRGLDGRPTGWELAISRTAIEVRMVGWTWLHQLRALLEPLPTLTITLVPTSYWHPIEADVEMLATPGRTITIA